MQRACKRSCHTLTCEYDVPMGGSHRLINYGSSSFTTLRKLAYQLLCSSSSACMQTRDQRQVRRQCSSQMRPPPGIKGCSCNQGPLGTLEL